MRPKVLEISWHETQAIYSCDFQPLPPAQIKRLLSLAPDTEDPSPSSSTDKTPLIAGGRQFRLATAGGDSKVRLWMIHPNVLSSSAASHAQVTGQDVTPHPPRAEYLATLSKHTAAVNVVRFSPNGQTLASAGDDGNVILWVPSDRPVASFGDSVDELPDKEHWRLQKMLQVTTKAIYDLAWSPDGEFIIAGATDNTATIWKASTGECVFALREHTHNVQGVSWDPLNEYIATQSSDRTVHVNSFNIRAGVPDIHPISRMSKMEMRHSRTPSVPSSSRPNFARRTSTASETGSVMTSASEHTDQPSLSGYGMAAGMTPTPSTSVPSTPQPLPNAMNPPINKPGSRRSSFSGSQAAGSPALSATHFATRARSPSPIPPLPAIRAAQTSNQAIMQRLYGEEGVTRFFRRLTFSPDGSLLLTPAGQIEDQVYKGSPMLVKRSLSHDGQDGSSSLVAPTGRPKLADGGKPTVYIYNRANLTRGPVAHLPGHKTASVAIRFSPVFYELRSYSAPAEPKHITLDRNQSQPVQVSLSMGPPPPPNKERDGASSGPEEKKGLSSVFALPYRLIYAVACQDSVMLYDTQQSGPIAIFKGLHYAGFTDIAWSPDGTSLMLSSADGYCSIVVFDMSELGTVAATQQHHRQLANIAAAHSHPVMPSHSHASQSSISSASGIPHSPALGLGLRHSPAPPARSEREGSTASSIAALPLPPAQAQAPPLFMGASSASHRRPSSTSSTDQGRPPTPLDDAAEAPGKARGYTSGSDSSTPAESVKRALGSEAEEEPRSGTHEDGAPKKKRRVALTHLGPEDEQ